MFTTRELALLLRLLGDHSEYLKSKNLDKAEADVQALIHKLLTDATVRG